MKFSHKLIVVINWFGTGLLVPVLSLMLLSRGCTLASLGVAIGVYSGAVIIAEVPTGVFADICGRKKAVLLSCAAYAISFGLILLTNRLLLLIPAMIFQGLGRAFSSGSIEALIIEDAMEKNGGDALPKTTASLAVMQSIGIALGAILGGVLPVIEGYNLHLMLRISLLVIVFVLAVAFIKEKNRRPVHRISLKEHLIQSRQLLSAEKSLRYVLLCIAAASVMMFSIETYWQPAFIGLAGDNARLFLGFLSAAGFGATALGSFIMGKVSLRTHCARWTVYLILLSAMAVSLSLIAVTHAPAVFIILYILWYMFLGGANIPEQTIINLTVPDEKRASIISAASLSCQLGGIVSSAVCSLVILGAGFSAIWVFGPVLTVVAVIFVIWRMNKQTNNCSITKTGEL